MQVLCPLLNRNDQFRTSAKIAFHKQEFAEINENQTFCKNKRANIAKNSKLHPKFTRKTIRMAKFRRNHDYQGKKGGSLVRVGLFAAILCGLIAVYNQFAGMKIQMPEAEEQVTPVDRVDDKEYYLPRSKSRQVVQHKYFSLGYNELHEQADWVAYVLTRERLNENKFERPDRFEDDPLVKTGSASWYDYRGSGYDRGHLVPAADMSFDEKALNETFYMSNISPQARDFNKGVWKELEELTRDWARKFKKLYIVTGPILEKGGKGSIGKNEVTIPTAYYKVLLDISEPEMKGIAFVIPNEVSYEPLFKYAKSIDEVEKMTGINFFPELMSNELEKAIESKYNLDLWPFSKKRFELRVNKWNKEP